jgi:hypothetical protein
MSVSNTPPSSSLFGKNVGDPKNNVAEFKLPTSSVKQPGVATTAAPSLANVTGKTVVDNLVAGVAPRDKPSIVPGNPAAAIAAYEDPKLNLAYKQRALAFSDQANNFA